MAWVSRVSPGSFFKAKPSTAIFARHDVEHGVNYAIHIALLMEVIDFSQLSAGHLLQALLLADAHMQRYGMRSDRCSSPNVLRLRKARRPGSAMQQRPSCTTEGLLFCG